MDLHIKKQRAASRTMDATAAIGKNGLTPHILNHLKVQLRARKMIKIKVLRSATGDEDLKVYARNLAGALGARLIDTIGRVVVVEYIAGKD